MDSLKYKKLPLHIRTVRDCLQILFRNRLIKIGFIAADYPFCIETQILVETENFGLITNLLFKDDYLADNFNLAYPDGSAVLTGLINCDSYFLNACVKFKFVPVGYSNISYFVDISLVDLVLCGGLRSSVELVLRVLYRAKSKFQRDKKSLPDWFVRVNSDIVTLISYIVDDVFTLKHYPRDTTAVLSSYLGEYIVKS